MDVTALHAAELATTGQSALEVALGTTRREGARVHALLDGLRIDSVFQPLVSLSHGRVVGHEGLLRATAPDGTQVSPLEVLARSRSAGREVLVDRVARAVHVANFVELAPPTGWLLLNLSPAVLVEGRAVPFFQDLVRHFHIDPSRVVVEILESSATDELVVADAASFFRDLGCLVAIDDFGAGHSNFERIWRIAPDIVKLDRVITLAARHAQVRRILPRLVSLFHEVGCLVTMEGIETEDDLVAALEADVDFAQGFYLARGEPAPLGAEAAFPVVDRAAQRLVAGGELAPEQRVFQAAAGLVDAAASALLAGAPFAEACAPLLASLGVARCFLLDGDGVQIGVTLESPRAPLPEDPRYAPLADGEGGNWARRSYYRRATAQPREVQISQRYLSIRDRRPCVTLSLAFPVGERLHVLCADLDWELCAAG